MAEIENAEVEQPLETLIVIYDSAIDELIMEQMHKISELIGCECRYTKLAGATGKGTSGEREGSWQQPGQNNIVFCSAPSERIRRLAGELLEFRRQLIEEQGPYPYYDFKLIILPTIAVL